jgi:hypothetical protein
MWRAELTHDNDRHCEFRPAFGRGRTRLTFATASGRQKPPLYPLAFSETFWSGRRDSNPRPQPWQVEVGGLLLFPPDLFRVLDVDVAN